MTRGSAHVEPITAVMLDGANPIDVGGERLEPERQPLHHGRGSNIEDAYSFALVLGVAQVPGRLYRDRAAEGRNRESGRKGPRKHCPHLKSRRENTTVETASNAAM